MIDRADNCALAGTSTAAVKDLQRNHFCAWSHTDDPYPVGQSCNCAGNMGSMPIAIGKGTFAVDSAF